ncbi:DUF397 domain-containing protein [Streptomyces netropsis]|uniref:DUF397 domain-containing protein n=1 Tax=Streptomyces netropsis TaxID=55404 RepID=UPI00379D6628
MQQDFHFRKSSFSSEAVECVEIATNIPDIVAIRDSKAPEGPILRVSSAPWDVFRQALTRGAFDR